MKLTVVRAGGIAGLVTTTTADSSALSPEEAETMRARVEGSGLLQMPARVSGPERQPDAFDYEVTVEDEGRTQRITLTEDALPTSVRSLISWLDSVPGKQERIGSPGPERPGQSGRHGPERPGQSGRPGPERPGQSGRHGPE